MSANAHCPHCHAAYRIPPEALGRQFKCQKCGQIFTGQLQQAPLALRWYQLWYVWAGVAVGVMLLAMVVLMFLTSRSSPPEPLADTPAPSAVAPNSSPEPAPASASIVQGQLTLEAPAEFSLSEGTPQVLEVRLERENIRGPVEVEVEGLPAGVAVSQPVAVPAGEASAKLELTATEIRGDSQRVVTVVARAGGVRAETQVDLQLRSRPALELTARSAVALRPTGTIRIPVEVKRGDPKTPLAIGIAKLPAGITADELTLAPDQSAGELVLHSRQAAEKVYPLTIVATQGEETAEAPLEVTVERFAFRVVPLAFPVAWVTPGETVEVPLKFERRSYQGPLEVTVEEVPEGMAGEVLVIPPGEHSGVLKLTAASSARGKVRSGRIVARGEAGSSQTLLIARVKTAEGSLLADLEIGEEFAGTLQRGSFGGRLTPNTKQRLLDLYGGTEESERAVLLGLRWLAEHQSADGRWSLGGYSASHQGCNCKTEVEGNVDKNDTAATAFGILPMLGAGVTPTSAPDYPVDLQRYQSNVRRGLEFLVRNQKRTNDANNGDLQGGMYAHALGTIALCEAYALTKDDALKVPAQLAMRYLITAQHSTSGSWGYSRNRLGDTSIVAWVVLALRSGYLAGLPAKRSVLDRTERFLNNTAAGPEPYRFSRYAYKPVNLEGAAEGAVQAKLSTTAAGLLCRQYLGWPAERKEFQAASDYLLQHMAPDKGTRVGPNYYYYYATQVLHHLEGKNWDLWNHFMREHLLRCQQQDGHARGSWSPVGSDYGPRGGRIYTTSMCLLTLEAYYRHLPLYRTISAR